MTPKSAASLAPPLAEAPLPEAPAAAAREIVLASDNPGKLREFAQLFAGYEVKVSPQSAFGVPAAAETGADFVDNALIKARHAAALVGERLVVADDSGLEVDALDGAPGLRSARYAGVGASAADNLRLLLKNLAGAPRSPARFRCAVACLRRADDPAPVVATGVWEGQILAAPRGLNGFGYDPVFYLPEQGRTAAELPPDLKNALSHRGQALRALLEKMKHAKLLD